VYGDVLGVFDFVVADYMRLFLPLPLIHRPLSHARVRERTA